MQAGTKIAVKIFLIRDEPSEQLSVFGFLLLIIAYHLFTLEIQPLPWFDEVYFASIADNFINNGSLVPEIGSYARNGRPALTYGPVYFFLQAYR